MRALSNKNEIKTQFKTKMVYQQSQTLTVKSKLIVFCN